MAHLKVLPTSGDADDDQSVVRNFEHQVRVVCDDLWDDPTNPQAQEAMLALLQNSAPRANQAMERRRKASMPSAV